MSADVYDKPNGALLFSVDDADLTAFAAEHKRRTGVNVDAYGTTRVHAALAVDIVDAVSVSSTFADNVRKAAAQYEWLVFEGD